MSGDRWAAVAVVIGSLTLVASGVVARRLPIRRVVALVCVWFGIFAAATAITYWMT